MNSYPKNSVLQVNRYIANAAHASWGARLNRQHCNTHMLQTGCMIKRLLRRQAAVQHHCKRVHNKLLSFQRNKLLNAGWQAGA